MSDKPGGYVGQAVLDSRRAIALCAKIQSVTQSGLIPSAGSARERIRGALPRFRLRKAYGATGCEANRSEAWWGEAPKRPKGFSGGEALNGFAGPGYI
jgi:hypothetical protein